MKKPRHTSAEQAVRINSIGSGLELDDLESIVREESVYLCPLTKSQVSSPNLDVIVIPKVETARHLSFVGNVIDAKISDPDRRNRIRLIALIESAEAMLNLREIW